MELFDNCITVTDVCEIIGATCNYILIHKFPTIVQLASASLVLAFNSIVVLLTMGKTLHGAWYNWRNGVENSLQVLLLRDGQLSILQ